MRAVIAAQGANGEAENRRAIEVARGGGAALLRREGGHDADGRNGGFGPRGLAGRGPGAAADRGDPVGARCRRSSVVAGGGADGRPQALWVCDNFGIYGAHPRLWAAGGEGAAARGGGARGAAGDRRRAGQWTNLVFGGA